MQNHALQQAALAPAAVRAAPRPQAVDNPPPEPVANRITTMLIEAWARHAMASSGFGG